MAETGNPASVGTEESLSEHVPYVPESESRENSEDVLMTQSQAWNLYTTHSLSTWNVRTYEFAAIIFTASAYPDTLVAASIRGIVSTLASICFSSTVGRWIDVSPNRLKTLSSTIFINRFSVIAASILWIFIVKPGTSPEEAHPLSEFGGTPSSFIIKRCVFSAILALGVFEKLSGSANMISMERDWVVAASSPDGKPYDLTQLNSTMRRIDLICKLIAPILISILASATNIEIAVIAVGSMSLISFPVEFWCAKRVWDLNPRLRVLKKRATHQIALEDHELQPSSLWNKASRNWTRYLQDFGNYFLATAWIPSLSLAFLHFSALSYSATFITFLLSVGFSLDLITLARAAGSVVEISSTFVTPIGVRLLSRTANHGPARFREIRNQEDATRGLLEEAPQLDGGTETGLERLGLWGMSWQLLTLVPVLFALWALSSPTSLPPFIVRILTPSSSQPMLALILFSFLSLSRLGLWIFDLTTQQLTQTMTAPSQRSSFTGVEYSFVSLFALLQNVITIVLHRPEQFKWIALISWISVAISTVAYASWVWKMRGHLLHWDKFTKSCECVKIRIGHERVRVQR